MLHNLERSTHSVVAETNVKVIDVMLCSLPWKITRRHWVFWRLCRMTLPANSQWNPRRHLYSRQRWTVHRSMYATSDNYHSISALRLFDHIVDFLHVLCDDW